MNQVIKAAFFLMIFFVVGTVNAQNKGGNDGQAAMRASKIKNADSRAKKAPQKSQPAHSSLFDNLDTNKDGKISRDEADNSNLAIIKDRFDNLDTNKDGFLSRTEVQNARYNLNKSQGKAVRKSESTVKPANTKH